MNKSVRSVVAQLVAIIFAFIGALLLVGTFVPLLNPPIWKDVVRHSGNNGADGWALFQYVFWYLGGLGLSLVMLIVSWLLNTVNRNK